MEERRDVGAESLRSLKEMGCSSTVNLAFAGGRDGAVIVTDKKAEDGCRLKGRLVNRGGRKLRSLSSY